MHHGFEVDGAALVCPACGHAFEQRVRIVADVGLEPDLLPGRLNRTTCPACGRPHLASVPLLYHDPARELAVAFVPPAFLAQADDLVVSLLTRLLRAGGNDDPGDYLLAPVVVASAEQFAVEVGGGAAPVSVAEIAYHPNLRETLRWAEAGRRREVVATLEALSPVATPEQLVEVLNEQPMLLEPATFAALEAAAAAAEAEVERQIAELLGDVLALLHMQVPEEVDADESLPDDLPVVVEELLAAADIEAASEYLEPPTARDDGLRAALELERLEQREGMHEHARLFGEIVEGMMLPATPDDLAAAVYSPSARTDPSELSLAAVEALLAAATLDEAGEVLERYPELVGEPALRSLQRLAREAEAAGEEARASHIGVLVGVLVVALDEVEADDV